MMETEVQDTCPQCKCASQVRWSGYISPDNLGFALQIRCLTLRFSCYASFLWLCNKWPQIQCLKTILLYCLSVSVGRKSGMAGLKSRFWLLCSQLELRVLLQAHSCYWQNSFPYTCVRTDIPHSLLAASWGPLSATLGHLHSLACGLSLLKLATAP